MVALSAMAAEDGLVRSAEEEKILREIRDEKEQLWLEIQVQLSEPGRALADSKINSFVLIRHNFQDVNYFSCRSV